MRAESSVEQVLRMTLAEDSSKLAAETFERLRQV